MASHRFNPVALVFGLVFTAAGTIVLSGGELIDEGRPLIPAGLIALGVALLVQVIRRARPGDEAPSAVAAATAPDPTAWGDALGTSSPVSEADHLDRLFAPVDDELTRWDADVATNAAPEADAPDGGANDADPTEADARDGGASDADPTEAVDPSTPYDRRGGPERPDK